MICQIERLYKALAPQILACLRTIGASSSKDYHLLYTLATVSYETAPTLAPLLTYRWGHHLPKAEGVKPKIWGNSRPELKIYQTVRTFSLMIVGLSWKTSGKWETDWALELFKWWLIRSWCLVESGLLLESPFKHLRLSSSSFAVWSSDNTGILGTGVLVNTTDSTNMAAAVTTPLQRWYAHVNSFKATPVEDIFQNHVKGSSRTKKTVKKADIVCFGRPPPLNA